MFHGKFILQPMAIFFQITRQFNMHFFTMVFLYFITFKNMAFFLFLACQNFSFLRWQFRASFAIQFFYSFFCHVKIPLLRHGKITLSALHWQIYSHIHGKFTSTFMATIFLSIAMLVFTLFLPCEIYLFFCHGKIYLLLAMPK